MKVFKFGGASVKDASSVKNTATVIKNHGSPNLLVVVSAMGKTTNAMEEVIKNYFKFIGGKRGIRFQSEYFSKRFYCF